MPIYEYKCEACDHRMEAIQKMADDPLSVCPECDAPKLKKLMSAVAFRLKGSGWYETDFKAGDKKNLADSTENKPKTDKKETNSSDSGKKETKPAAAKESSTNTNKNKSSKKSDKSSKSSD